MATAGRRTFGSGEVSPATEARVDLPQYQTGLRTCRNWIVERSGSVSNRAGFEYIESTKASGVAILIPFIASVSTAYVLEFGIGYMRVYTNGARVGVSGLTAWSGATVYNVGDLVSHSGTNYYCTQFGSGNNPTLGAPYWYAMPAGGIYEAPTSIADPQAKLDWSQDGSVLVITGADGIFTITYSSATGWAIAAAITAPIIGQVSGLGVAGTAGASTKRHTYRVTAIRLTGTDVYDGEGPYGEVTASNAINDPATNAHTVSWTSIGAAAEYFIYYRGDNGLYGYVGRSRTNSFVYNGAAPDYSYSPTIYGTAPAAMHAVANYQQRRCYAKNARCVVSEIGTGNEWKFGLHVPVQDDDPIDFTLKAREAQYIRWLLPLERLVMLTDQGEWTIEGDTDGVLRPTAINPRQRGYFGSADVRPLVVGNTVIYVQARARNLRDLIYNETVTGFISRDLSEFSNHLFDGYTVSQIAWQKVPEPVVWAVRSDGTLLGMTYHADRGDWGWHRHDTGDGDAFEAITVIPEGGEDRLYAVVRRTVDGSTVRYVERLASREWTDIATDAIFLDSCLTYDGRHTAGTTTMTLSGGSAWDETEALTLTASASTFVAGDVGNEYVLRSATETIGLRCTVEGYTSGTVVTVRPQRAVVADLQATGTTDWSRAVDEVTGLDHLEGRTVGILADGNVHAQAVVASGAVTLARPYEVVHVGLPIVADLETLRLDSYDGEPLLNRQKKINRVGLLVADTRGLSAGIDLQHLAYRAAPDRGTWSAPVPTQTDLVEITVDTAWRKHGRIAVRQANPLPATVLALFASGEIGGI